MWVSVRESRVYNKIVFSVFEILFGFFPSHSLSSDLDLSALRALGLVMSGLVLQSKYKSSDVSEGKSKLFLK